MSQAELAEKPNRSSQEDDQRDHQGQGGMLTSETAVQLERVLGVSATFWAKREAAYRACLARVEEDQRLRAHTTWPREFPIKEMQQHDWLRPVTGTALVRELLSYFGIASPTGIPRWPIKRQFDLRTSAKFRDRPENALAAWLRRGEIIAKETDCDPFDRPGFVSALRDARRLTSLAPTHFVPRLIKLMRGVGVAVAFVPELPKTRAQGAARWITPSKALIQLSCRHKRNDILWFSFFHEAGHLLLTWQESCVHRRGVDCFE